MNFRPGEERLLKFSGEESGLTQYLREISRHKTLSLVEEAKLTAQIRHGNRKAMNKLINANLKFVVSVCLKYRNRGLPFTDLINEGNLGLIRAAKRFDETRNFKFISYAVWWIREAILRSLAEQSRMFTIPLNRMTVINRIGKAGVRLEQKLGRSVSLSEMSRRLSIDEGELQACRQLTANPISMDAPLKSEEGGQFGDMLKDENAEGPDEDLFRCSLREEISAVLVTLEPREEEVIRLYFGIGLDNGCTLEEIACKYNLTRERVRQIKEKALKKLRHCTRSDRLADFKP